FRPAVSLGPVYARVQPCGAPVDLRTAGWTATGVVPDVLGEATFLGPQPGPGDCRAVGVTAVIDGVESPAITSFVFGADCVDRDGDGSFTCARDCDGLLCKIDCDDDDPAIYPGATEICDGKDNNCDGRIDEAPDMDGDGVGDCVDNCPAVANPNQQ